MKSHAVSRATVALIVIVCASGLAGCKSIRPLPVNEPNWKSLMPGKVVGGDPATPTHLVTLSAANRDEAIKIANAYAETYFGASDRLHLAKFNANDFTFGGALLGMVGAITKSPEAAILGATTAGVSGTVSQRYAFEVQAANYDGAARAMLCLKGILESYPEYGQTAYFNQRVTDIRMKLRANQAKVDLASPDLAALQATIQVHVDAKRGVTEQENAIAELEAQIEDEKATNKADGSRKAASAVTLRQLGFKLSAAQRLLDEAKIKEVETALLKCSASY